MGWVRMLLSRATRCTVCTQGRNLAVEALLRPPCLMGKVMLKCGAVAV